MNGEKIPTNNEADSVIENDNPWQKMAEETPPFNPEQKQKVQVSNDSELVQEIINQNNDDQEELEYYIEKLEVQGRVLFDDQLEDLKKNVSMKYSLGLKGFVNIFLTKRLTRQNKKLAQLMW